MENIVDLTCTNTICMVRFRLNFFSLKKNNNLKHVIWFHRVWHETRMQYEHTCISLWFKDYWCRKTGILLHTTFFWIHLASEGIKMDSWKLRRSKMSWRYLLLNCFEIHFTSIEKNVIFNLLFDLVNIHVLCKNYNRDY